MLARLALDQLDHPHIGEHQEDDLPIVEGDRLCRRADHLRACSAQLSQPLAEGWDFVAVVVALHSSPQERSESLAARQGLQQLQAGAAAAEEQTPHALDRIRELLPLRLVAERRVCLRVALERFGGDPEVVEHHVGGRPALRAVLPIGMVS
jgi:hypothetical protein